MFAAQLIVFSLLANLASSVTVCSSSSILSTFTDPLCTSWCKVRLCSSGSCKSILSGDNPTCQCESCTFGSWFGSSSSSTNQPVNGQYYAAGSGNAATTQNDNYNNYDSRYNNYNSDYRSTAGYGNANSNFNTNQQYGNNYRSNQYSSNVPSGYGNGGQNTYASGYQNLKR